MFVSVFFALRIEIDLPPLNTPLQQLPSTRPFNNLSHKPSQQPPQESPSLTSLNNHPLFFGKSSTAVAPSSDGQKMENDVRAGGPQESSWP